MDLIASPEPADPKAFLEPFNDRRLLAYYDDLLRWHGYIRFLGLPYRKDEPDVPIEELFVEPRVSPRAMRPEDLNPEATQSVIDALVQHPRLVLLGDPGSGKSTLVSWIAWQLSRSAGSRLRTVLGDLIPVPMVLREIPIGRDVTWRSLWQSFLDLPVAAHLAGREDLDSLLHRGQLMLLFDGLDEVSSVAVREALREALFDGMNRYPKCRFVLTSRLVGFDDVPFDRAPAPPPGPPPFDERPPGGSFGLARWAQGGLAARDPSDIAGRDEKRVCTLLYVAPFSDEQIDRFSTNWYASREKADERASGGSRDLVESVRQNEHTLRLARIPNLLTFMALIHRVRAKLPDGRALLYDEIAEAYLETIDTFRGLQEMEVPLHQKMRWLGCVGYRMQLRRDAEEREDQDEDEEKAREILVDGETVEEWLREEMERDRVVSPGDTAARFLDYLGRRSGLLLPRGEGQFAFAHLSFQEFFAATYLLRLVIAPERKRCKIAPNFLEDLERWGGSADWRETLVLLGELLQQTDHAEDVIETLFGGDFQRISGDSKLEQQERVLLLAELTIDPHSALTSEDRARSLRVCWEWERRWSDPSRLPKVSGVPRVLLRAESPRLADVLEVLCEVSQDSERLILAGCPNLERPRVLRALAELSNLSYLDLSSTGVSDVSALSSLSNLSFLDLSSTGVSDVSSLSSLSNLSFLDLSSTGVSDVSSLSSLSNLSFLDLSSTGVSDVSSLSSLLNLSSLDLRSTGVSDVSALSSLSNLSYLYLSSTGVSDVSALSSLSNLRILDLNSTGVSDVSALSSLSNLRILYLNSTGVSEVSALSSLTNLKSLNLRSTGVSDVSALSKLKDLHIAR